MYASFFLIAKVSTRFQLIKYILISCYDQKAVETFRKGLRLSHTSLFCVTGATINQHFLARVQILLVALNLNFLGFFLFTTNLDMFGEYEVQLNRAQL